MNDKVGNISFYDPAQENYFTKPYSEETGKMIDQEVRKLIDDAYIKTKNLLIEKREDVEKLAKELLVKEVLFKSDVEALIGKRPYEEKKLLDILPEDVVSPEQPPVSLPDELKNPPDQIKAIKELQLQVKDMRQQLEQMELQKAASITDSLLSQVEQVNGINLARAEVALEDQKLWNSLLYQLGQELGDQSFLLLGARAEGKAQLMLYISEDLVKGKRLHAGNIIKDLARSIDGGGGGQPFFASAGGTAPEGLTDALQRAKGFIEN
jgi:hypothetical protein